MCITFKVSLAKNFCLKHTGRHFIKANKVIKLCSEHTKTSKTTKNQKSKVFLETVLSSIYEEESKNNNLKKI